MKNIEKSVLNSSKRTAEFFKQPELKLEIGYDNLYSLLDKTDTPAFAKYVPEGNRNLIYFDPKIPQDWVDKLADHEVCHAYHLRYQEKQGEDIENPPTILRIASECLAYSYQFSHTFESEKSNIISVEPLPKKSFDRLMRALRNKREMIDFIQASIHAINCGHIIKSSKNELDFTINTDRSKKIMQKMFYSNPENVIRYCIDDIYRKFVVKD